MIPSLVLLSLLSLSADAPPDALLGTPLQQDGYNIRPPRGFRTMPKDLFSGSRAFAIATEPSAERGISASLMDRDDESAAMMAISWIDSPFSPSPTMRDAFATAVVRHFNDELSEKLTLETIRTVEGPAPRVEVIGTVKQEAQVRRVRIAAFEGDPRHAVVLFSVPSGRDEELTPAIEASLDSFRVETSGASTISRGLAGALAGAALGALLVSFGLWRTRQRRLKTSG